MFGILRTILALMVMCNHLLIGSSPFGAYAVFGFYIISGYLMTLIMHERYGFTMIGRASYLLNRFLRLYPQYWSAAAFSIVLICFLGAGTVQAYHTSIFMPVKVKDILSNFTIFFPAWLPNTVTPRLVPPTWALTVEIFFYVLIFMGISSTLNRVRIWLVFSIIYLVFALFFGAPSGRYYPVTAASLPFSIGSYIYFLSKNENIYARFIKLRISSSFLFILLLENCLLFTILYKVGNSSLTGIGFYLNIAISAILVYSLVKGGKIIHITKKLDKFIGDFSYPIYLLHWQTGLLVSFLLYGQPIHEFSVRGSLSFFISLISISLLSLLFVLAIDQPVQYIRNKIKANLAAGGFPSPPASYRHGEPHRAVE